VAARRVEARAADLLPVE
jgi:Putative transposase